MFYNNLTYFEPGRLRIERHKTLQGKAGRRGHNHLEQIRDGMSEFYSQIVSGLRSVEAMPARTKISPEATYTEEECIKDSNPPVTGGPCE